MAALSTRGARERELEGAPLVFLTTQAKGWCQAMCLNVGRTRRRLRKTLTESWRLLAQHAANADASPEFQHHLAAAGWRWRQHDSEGYSLQACTCFHPCSVASSYSNVLTWST